MKIFYTTFCEKSGTSSSHRVPRRVLETRSPLYQMKDVFASRCVSEFGALVADFADSLEESLPRSDAVREWASHVRATAPRDLLEEWNAAITAHMSRQHAKYVRAVAAITGQPVVVYHAVRYKDATAVDACHSPLAKLSCAVCTRDLSEGDTALFWKYLWELSSLCYKHKQTDPPAVPTSAEIGDNIRSRRAQRDAPAPTAAEPVVRGLTQGVDDLWTQLCTKRGVSVPITEAIRKRIRECVRGEFTGDALSVAFPDLGADPFTSEQTAVVERMRNLVTMDDAIPSDMMRGIEAVASRLATDIHTGRCDLSSLDIESIGQQVLSGVNDDDMSKFASNLDTIIPALQRAHQG